MSLTLEQTTLRKVDPERVTVLKQSNDMRLKQKQEPLRRRGIGPRDRFGGF